MSHPNGPGPHGVPPQGPPQGPPPGTGPGHLPPPAMPFPPGPGGPYPPPGAPYGGPPVGMPPMNWAGPAPTSAGAGTAAGWVLGVIALAGVVLGISLVEDGQSQWHSVHAWGGLAIVGALLTLAPVAGMGLAPLRAWQCAVAGGAALVVYWALFVLPAVGSNTSLVTTVGVGAGVVAAWLAPGRPAPAPNTPPGW